MTQKKITTVKKTETPDVHRSIAKLDKNIVKSSKSKETKFKESLSMSFVHNDNAIRPRKFQTNLTSWGNKNGGNSKTDSTFSKPHLLKSVFNLAKDNKGKSFTGRHRSDDADREMAWTRRRSEGGYQNDLKCSTNVRHYLQKSTLHGMRYIGDGQLSLLERVFWFTSVFAAVLFAAYFIGNLYIKWTNSPVIVSLNPDPAQITTIPFPAITVCNVNLARKTVANKIIQNGKSVDKKLLEAICSVTINDSTIIDIDSVDKAREWSYFKHFLINVTQPCSQLLAQCKWKSQIRNCQDLFNTALTDEGLCCTFNSLHRDIMFINPRDLSDLNVSFPFPAVDWSPEAGYPNDIPTDGFPWRPIGAGSNLGLTLTLDADIEEYYCSSTSSIGFKESILLHNPAETPKISEFGDFLTPGLEMRVAVKPRIYDYQPDLRNINVHKRRCYFSDEKKLVYYRTYTQKNCALECETRLTIERCNCSQYYMPKNSSVRICGMADYNCFNELQVAIEDKLGVNESAILVNTNCDDCYPACYELSYNKDISSAYLSDTIQYRDSSLTGKTVEYFKKNMALVHIYFVDTSFIRYTKGEIYGFTDFLSNTGGLLGLFMGFSFLSFVEVVYFLSLRLVCSLYRNNYKNNEKVFPFSQ